VQVRRTFKRSFGMTFQAYQRACRLGTAMRALHDGSPTLDAGMGAGFESDSGFRAAFARVFGETPGQARGTALLTATWIETPLGPMLAIAGDRGLELNAKPGRRCAGSRTARREAIRSWPATSALLPQCAPSAASTGRTGSRSWFRVIASFAPTGRSAAMAADAGGSSGCSITRGLSLEPEALKPEAYSCLSAVAGSVRVARRAGM
jgi:hypothetical protein